MEKKTVLFDCDNTMGVPGCDVDDGLALLYLLGQEKAEICAITTTYGNSDIDTVYRCTEQVLHEIGRQDIPLLRGCPDRDSLNCQASSYLENIVNHYQGKLSILATGSLTNLYSAYLLDPAIFSKTKEVIIMGGITEPLVINGQVLNELNFACDPAAVECILKHGQNLSVITGNNCLKAFFDHDQFQSILAQSNLPGAKYIVRKCRYWFDDMMARFNLNGFHNWDVAAAAYIVNPDLFSNKTVGIKLTPGNLEQGLLEICPADQADCVINIPEIRDSDQFTHHVYQSWLNFRL